MLMTAPAAPIRIPIGMERDAELRMRRLGLILACAVAATALAGCTSKAILLNGDEKSVDVGYSGDVAVTLPVATKHCAGYERAPKLISASSDTAYYDCERR